MERTTVSGGHDQTLRLWETAAAANCEPLQSHAARSWCVTFSMDGRLIASGHFAPPFACGRQSGREERRLMGHRQMFPARVKLAADGVDIVGKL